MKFSPGWHFFFLPTLQNSKKIGNWYSFQTKNPTWNYWPNDRMKISPGWHFFLPTLQNTVKKIGKKIGKNWQLVSTSTKGKNTVHFILMLKRNQSIWKIKPMLKSQVKMLFIIITSFSENIKLKCRPCPLSRFYPDSILNLSWFYPNLIKIFLETHFIRPYL